MAYDFIRYANQGATRNRPVSDQLASSLAFLPDIGVTAEVFSGGQPGRDEGGARVGSTRHDHGNAADVRFYQGDRQLDWSNPDDLPIFTEIVRRGKEAGLTGFGAGPNYMAPGTMHVGFGSPGVWGAGGKSANAPEWLRTAYGEASDVGTGGQGQTMAYGGASNDTLGIEPMAPPTNPGGLGGLGGFQGFVNNPEFGDTLQAIGLSLMSSPSNNPFAGVADNLANRQNLRARQQDRQEARAERQQDRQAIEALLRSQGFNADEARAYSGNASAANAAITQRREVGEENKTKTWLKSAYPDLAEQVDQGLPISEGLRIAQERRKVAAGGDESFFGNPVAMQNADGTVSYGQIGNRGTFKAITLPEGQSFAPPTKTVDTGTEVVLLDQAGNVISRTPKENRREAADTAAGTVEGRTAAERAASASGDATNAQNALDLLGKIRNDPYLERGTGFSSLGNFLPGTGGYDFSNRVEQAKSGAFLQAIQQMKGLGALSNNEGAAATSAITRMDVATSKEAFLEALDDYEKIVRQGLARAQQNASSGAPAAPAPAPAQAEAPVRRRAFNPATGGID